MGAVRFLQVELVHFCNCGVCGVPIYGPGSRKEQCLRHGSKHAETEYFYCINGHRRCYGGHAALEQAERERDEATRRAEFEKNRREAAERQLIAAKGQITKAKNRAAAGLCPCCNRSFTNLRKHMTTKHPDHGGGRDV